MAKRKFYRKIVHSGADMPSKTRPQKKKRGGRLSFIFKIFSFLFITSLFSFLFLFIYYARDLPRPEKFTERQFIQSTKIYDRTGEILLYDIHGEEKRTIISLNQIPEYLKQAVIAAEDTDFYHHFGIDFRGIFRAILTDLRLRQPLYGGSTIPQQLIRSTFFSTEKTLQRKIREIILSLELDRRYSKDQVLEWYLNQVPFGSNCYGVEAASQTFFNKSISDISLAEAATLASLIRAPSYLSPYYNREELMYRKNYILERMVALGFLSEEESKEAKEEVLEFAKPKEVGAPYFTLQYVMGYLENKYGEDFLREKGLKIYTSLDWELQEWAERVIQEGVEMNKGYNCHNATLVAIDPQTGEILAMVGGANYLGDPYPDGCTPGKNCKFDPQFNTATLGLRQPGSAFKPFVYATAFKKGFTPNTTVIDEKTNFGIWGGEEYIPENYDGKFRGEITFRQALAQSINVASVKVLLDFAGPEIEDSAETAESLGITTLKPPYGPSIVLGGWEVKLLEMVSAYGVFASEGMRVPPVGILKIEDMQGKIIEENKKTQKRVLSIQVARMINSILSDNEARAPMFGWESPLYFEDYQVAAKTGTNENYQDAWTIGFTPQIVVGVWAGNNNNSPMLKKPGVVLAGPIFHRFLEKALQKYPKEFFREPEINSL